jgi:nucleoside 2-deoxyribosyltransferase
MTLIYFARGIDDLDRPTCATHSAVVGKELASHGLQMVDPVAREACLHLAGSDQAAVARALVEFDLSLLRRCDAVLMDMTIPNRNYVGCTAELVYAHLWRIPAVVYVGATGNDRRHWLRYHASEVVADRTEAVQWLANLFEAGAATPPERR